MVGRSLRIACLAACLTVVIASCAAPPKIALNMLDASAFRAVVQTLADDLMVPGAMVLVRTPQGTVTASVGTTELGAQIPPATDTHFRIASNTKTMTAALTVLLAQDGRLSFDDPVSAYVPGVPSGEHITIAHLLTMRSGLYGYTADPQLSAAMDQNPDKEWAPQEVLDIAFRHPPVFAPNSSYEYSNTNYALLGLIAEKAGGAPLRAQFEQRLFEPIGLTHTTLPAADDTTLPAPSSHGYMFGGSFYALGDDPHPADMQTAARDGSLAPVDYTFQNSSYASAAGGAVSTAEDLATWIKALAVGQVFDPDFHQQWLASLRAEDPDVPDGQKYGYGISYQRFGPNAAVYYHGGELPGFNSFMGYDPDNDVTLVIWTNLTRSPDGRTTAQAMLAPILDEIYADLSLVSPTTTG